MHNSPRACQQGQAPRVSYVAALSSSSQQLDTAALKLVLARSAFQQAILFSRSSSAFRDGRLTAPIRKSAGTTAQAFK